MAKPHTEYAWHYRTWEKVWMRKVMVGVLYAGIGASVSGASVLIGLAENQDALAIGAGVAGLGFVVHALKFAYLSLGNAKTSRGKRLRNLSNYKEGKGIFN